MNDRKSPLRARSKSPMRTESRSPLRDAKPAMQPSSNQQQANPATKPNTVAYNPNNILIAVRIRPLSTKETNSGHISCCQALQKKFVAIKKAGDSSAYLKSQSNDVTTEYAFDEAFGPSCSQQEVYERTIKSFIPNLLTLGQHVTVFAYGATGAGKSHTMFGSMNENRELSSMEDNENESRGVIFRSVQEVFHMLAELQRNAVKGESWKVGFSFCEVYNEQVYDLLEYTGKTLSIREDSERGIVQIAGLTEVSIVSVDQVLSLVRRGQKVRKMEPTMANSVSSRSHAIIQLTVHHKKPVQYGKEITVESKLSLIDLAGSERASVTCNRGIRLQEGANINKSLLALANCINALSENALNTSNEASATVNASFGSGDGNTSQKKFNVKYRDSKLTHLLKTSLEGNCNLIMIANINPSDQTYEDSYRTLLYSHRAKNLKLNPTMKESLVESTSLIRENRLKDENDSLRHQISILQRELEQSQRLIEELQTQLESNKERRMEEAVQNKSSSSPLSRFSLLGNKKTDRMSMGISCDLLSSNPSNNTHEDTTILHSSSPLHAHYRKKGSLSPCFSHGQSLHHNQNSHPNTNTNFNTSYANHEETMDLEAFCASKQPSFDMGSVKGGSISPKSRKSSSHSIVLNNSHYIELQVEEEEKEDFPSETQTFSLKRPLEELPDLAGSEKFHRKKMKRSLWRSFLCGGSTNGVVQSHSKQSYI